MTGGYDEGYAACPCFWGREPGSFVASLVDAIGTVADCKVLDVGCGEGKNAAFLANRGASVVAIDISEVALRNGMAAWPKRSIQWLNADIRVHDLGETCFDLVVAYGLFHCLQSVSEIQSLHAKLSAHTRLGGYHVVCAFNDRNQDLAAHPGFVPCLLAHSFYEDLYRSWEICRIEDSDLHETHPHNNIAHVHSLTRIIARRVR